MERRHADEREKLVQLSQQQGTSNEVRKKVQNMTEQQQNAKIFELSVSLPNLILRIFSQ